MKSYSKSPVCNFAPGTKIVGKWHNKPYKIIKQLGSGATGSVYLADSQDGRIALKIGINNMAITSEVNVLKHFSKVQGQVLGPSLLDVDDLVSGGNQYPFYVMEYLKGQELLQFIQKRGDEWIGILVVQLLGDLDRLHRAGWVFGDLKPDNLIVVGPPARIRWFDVGGTTLLGRSIKEYTEFYDRGYWGQGTRKAEPSYDLFAVAMIMINCCYPSRFEKKSEKGIEQLKEAITAKSSLRPYEGVLMKALQGRYEHAQEMRKELVDAISSHTTYKPKPKRSQQRQAKRKRERKQKSSVFVEIFLVVSFILLAYILYLFGQLM
ncbi:serine/threonine protein kinase [Desertibacillus haloalkaliphilus]|uniref:serine/threonine protein kinase n=1 Tax=Desertibacillus haloalkaliphilus TaxID=1328930 RepID=UPI001C27D829|nr:phosphotransferase [Desertibacillus haloalkaliphilus]MBU8908444.1 phosphotransferase [Desertibacillus haloalkaliphilus]